MLRNVLIGLVLILGVLVMVDRARRSTPKASVVVGASGTVTTVTIPQAPPPAATRTTTGVLPGVAEQSSGTPGIDMLARLAVRRRIEREGNRVYIDSLLRRTDSVLARWADRDDQTLRVHYVVDSLLPSWSRAALDDAKAGLRFWTTNDAGLRFREVAEADSADISVKWNVTLADSGQVGLTSVNWGSDGSVRGASVILALRLNGDSSVVPSSVRQRVAAHEFGHALGLPHSGDRDDLMFSTSPVTALSRRDQATLQLLYAVPPGPLRTPQ